LADVEAIAEYIEKDSPFYARAVVAKVVAATRHLGQYPLSGRVVPEKRDPAFREVFAFSYRIIYLVEEYIISVSILTFEHFAEHWGQVLQCNIVLLQDLTPTPLSNQFLSYV
jgi:plasmid stabilization system protein ParE